MAKAKKVEEETNTSPAGSWFSKGDAGFQRKHQQDKFAAMRREKGAPRLYLKTTPGEHIAGDGVDNEARLVFLDSAGFWIHEHNLQLEGRWGNYFTCVKDFQPCEICIQRNDKSIYTCYFTVIDLRKFTRADGSVSKYRKILLPAKGAAIDVIENLKKIHGDLRGLVVDVRRASDRDPNCGRDFNVVLKDGKVVRIDPSKKFEDKDMATPFDYMKVLAPPTVEELAVAGIQTVPVVGSAEDLDEDADTPPVDDSGVTDTEMDNLLGDEA